MKRNHPWSRRAVRWSRALLAFSGLALLTAASLQAEMTAVATRVFNKYERTRLPNGKFKTETYAMANGGCWDSMPGDSIDKIPFRQVTAALAAPMSQRGYVPVPATEPGKTDLLVIVMWGTTAGTEAYAGAADRMNLSMGMRRLDDLRRASRVGQLSRAGAAGSLNGATAMGFGPENLSGEVVGSEMETYLIMAGMEQRYRDKTDVKNAMLLGFQDDLVRAYDLYFTTWGSDFLSDLRMDRYYVILKAYDFQLAWKEKKKKILWEARFSVPRSGTDFAKVLPSMTKYASRFFGEDTKGLVRDRLPDVNITYGEAKMLGYEP